MGDMQKKSRLTFPKNFMWGASVSAHQVEGGLRNQWTVWEQENASTKAAQAPHQFGDLESWETVAAEAKQPAMYVSGKATQHREKYEEDFDFLKRMNMNTFRFSIEWSRIEPEEGAWNAEAIEYYKRYIKALKKRGIEPVVTLFHFTLPLWFSELGGFEKRRNSKYFVRYAQKIIRELGISVRYIITVNEPEVYANESYLQGNWPPNRTSFWLAWRVQANLLHAHKQAARAIRLLNRRYKVSFAKNSPYYYAGDDAWLSRASAWWLQYIHDDYMLKRAVRHCDFMAVNYYFSNRVYGYRVHNPDEKVSDMGWDLSPANIQYALERLHERYQLPIMITENGLADANDAQRQWFITQTITGIHEAMKNDVKVIGYLHWSLLDNFEWDKGRWPRFGLVAVDYKTGKRTIRPSGEWFGKVIARLRKG